MDEYDIFWGEAHDNTFQFQDNPDSMEDVLRRAQTHLDFYAAAYYTSMAAAFQPGGHLYENDKPHDLILEGWKSQEQLEREWQEVQEACRSSYRAGSFVTFPGYEWQGDGSSGDHNVFFFREGYPIFRVNTITELYRLLREKCLDEAVAIPHHTGYRPGVRGRDWSVFDEQLSPFAEVFSVHGCSETDEEWIGLRPNSHMGPGQGGGTYQDALDRGYHLGAVCSTDNWGEFPGRYGRGLMACQAEELTRESLWRAFKARRVYGVTGDRIRLNFNVNGAPMGSILECSGKRKIQVRVQGADALDRVEILRAGRVLTTHCHQGTWKWPDSPTKLRFKLRVEAGWGPRPNEMAVENRKWNGILRVGGGRIIGYDPCWLMPGQSTPRIEGDTATFALTSSTQTLGDRSQNALVFEIEAEPGATARLELNGLVEEARVEELARGSRLLWYRDECVKMLEERAGIPGGSPEREDVYWGVAFKAKIHRPIPETGYSIDYTFEDDEPLTEETHYRIRVEQRNAQRAWSSPIWVKPGV